MCSLKDFFDTNAALLLIFKMGPSFPNNTPNKSICSNTIQTTLLSQGSSVSSIQESPNVKKRSNFRNFREDVATRNESRRLVNEEGYESGCDISHTSSVIDAHRTSIFDYKEWITLKPLPYTNKKGEEKVKIGWECMFCHKQFMDRNATKVLCHLAGIKDQHIVVCQGAIPSKHMKVIMQRKEIHFRQKLKHAKVKSKIDESVCSQQQSILAGMEAMSNASTKGMSNMSTSNCGTTIPNVTMLRSKELDVAISDFIYSKGLPFSVCDSPHFKHMIQCARYVTAKYKVPNRNRMSTDLLDCSYKQRLTDYHYQLRKDAARFGISMYGDGATVMKMPLINIMASGVYQRSAVLDIVDTSNHMSKGGRKDALYIAQLFEPYIQKLDPDDCLVDTVFLWSS